MDAGSSWAYPRQDPHALHARHRFAALVAGRDDAIDVAVAVALVAAEEHLGADTDAMLKQIDDLAARVRRRLADARDRRPGANPDELAIGALHGVMFDDEGFQGATLEEYPRPEASLLDLVLARRRGLPILLAIVYCAVARRAGLDAVGVGLPGHFIVEFRGMAMRVLVDPFDRGRRLTIDDAEAIVARVTGREIALRAHHFQAVPPRRTILRVLENLKGAYLRQGDYPRALEVVERILLVAPTAETVRDRGLLLREVSMPDGANLSAAWFDLRLYARVMASAPDAEAIRRVADEIWTALGRSN